MRSAFMRWFRQGGWEPIAWLSGISALEYWTYCGMPMICH